MWVLDATPLVYLATVDRLDLLDALDALDGPVLVPERVYEEVVTRGIEAGYPDARRIERFAESGSPEVVGAPEGDVFDRLRETPALSEADAAVLTCASNRDGTAVMDEAAGRDAADVEGIESRGTAYVVLRLVERDVLAPDEAREIIDGMVEAGWYCSPELYTRIVRRIEAFDEG